MNVILYNVYRHSNSITHHKIGFTTDFEQRMSEYKRNGWTHKKVIANIPFSDKLFRNSNGVIYLSNKVEGINLKPDEMLHKLIVEFGYGKRVSNFDGISEEVFQFDIDKLPANSNDEDTVNKFIEYLTQVCIVNDFDYNRICKIVRNNKPEYIPYYHQSLVDVILKDKEKFGLKRILCDLPPRFGKTTWCLNNFVSSNKNVMILMQYWLSPATSFKDEINRYSTFSDIEYYDLTDVTRGVDSLPTTAGGRKIIVVISLCGDLGRKKFNQFVNWADSLDPQTVIKVCDEVDYGSSKDKQIVKINKICPDAQFILMTGSGAEKVATNFEFDSNERQNIVSLEYNDLLLMQDNNHYTQNVSYIDILKQNMEDNKNQIEFLERVHTVGYSQFKNYVNLIRPVYITVDYKHLIDKINQITLTHDISSIEQTSYSKINSKPKLYSSVHTSILSSFFGLDVFSEGSLFYGNVASEMKDDIRVFQFWTSCDNGPLNDLADVFRSVPGLGEKFHVEVVNGDYTTNKDAEGYVRNIINNLPVNKRLILLCKHMAARSFSISEIDAQVFYTDSCNIDTAKQKSSRGSTPGFKLDIHKNNSVEAKRNSYIFDLSFIPDESITETIINNTIKNQLNKGRSMEESHNIVMRTLNYFILCKDAKLQRVVSFDMSRLEKLKRVVDGDIDNKFENELSNIIDGFDVDDLALFDFAVNSTSKSELANIIKGAKSSTKKGKRTVRSNSKAEKDLKRIKQNILNYACKSYYHVYLIYSMYNKYDNTPYHDMFKDVVVNHKNLLFDSFDQSVINKVSDIIYNFCEHLNRNHNIYAVSEERLNFYLKNLRIEQINVANK